ncbi:hypothetical protein C7N43_08230 [Sphingobacteriales bacterium UPWRP_1]|nr:hypothetical protein B6N25_11165 [Sphingobacteriales bacterium TSM_CSS]PSJ77542.1 hypothetical protein C7N43_08230 [Sphingobacteriales bacterium UPWRP_1]
MEIILYLIVSLIGVYFLLAIGNQPYGQRWKQYWIPVLGALLVALAIYEYYTEVDYLIRQGSFLPMFRGYAEIMYSLLVIGAFGIFKLLVNEGGKLFVRKQQPNAPQQVPRFSLAYKTDDKGGIVIKKEWVFAGLYAKYLAWLGLVLFVLVLALKILDNELGINQLNISALSAFAIFIVLEMHWYLKHPRIEEQPEPPAPEPEKTTVPLDYYNLWEEYQRIWFDKLLLAWKFNPPQEKAHSPTTIEIIEAQNLVNAGFTLTLNDYDILQNLANQTDMLIDDMVLDEVAPLLFSVFLRRLMDGENILVLTAKRCYPNSKYHQQIVDWINDWIYRLTSNREFFRVQTFSRVEDVEFTSRIIVTSADDILDKNIIGHNWFTNLKTLLFLNGDEIFSESLTSNNILLNILRGKFNKIQSIVLSDYREALQASVMHNLEVKRNLREVRMRHDLPATAFVILWKLEGASLFQHKVLTGYIEKFLGAEVVLALLARRERITDIRLAGQELLPYYEYLEETDNNSGGLNQAVVAPRTLKYKGINEVKCNEVNAIMSVGENTFLLVRDAEYNLITALRKWQQYATANLFLHVVSPPYLLRAYFADHIEYFWRTPVYGLSSKMMTSRFEVARTLLEQLVIQEMSENQILQYLIWINPNAVFVKQELQNLFSVAFDIDIIAANYLSIRAAFEYDRETDSFKQVTKYGLLPRIKDNINLSFLKKAEIVQGADTLEVTSMDLLFQNYLPDQTHSFAGRPYTIRGFDKLNYKMLAAYRSPLSVLAYRSDLEVTLNRLDQPLNESQKKNLLKKVTLELCEGSFDVRTRGYFTFTSDISLQTDAHSYTTVTDTEVPVRSYQLGRVMVLSIETPDDADVVKLTATFSALLTELMCTLFPETFSYILIGSPLNQLAYKGKFAQMFPMIRVKDQQPVVAEKVMQICIFEDAHQDLGLVQSIFDNWDYIFRVLDDYLVWFLDATTSGSAKLFDTNSQTDILRKPKPAKDQFLKYGGAELPEFFDLKAASALLRNLLGNNYMTSQRNDFYLSK